MSNYLCSKVLIYDILKSMNAGLMDARIKKFTGTKIGMLTALRPIPEAKHGTWEFRCNCGNICRKRKGNVIRNKTFSCGCRHANTKHGMSMVGRQDYSKRLPVYQAWVNMRQRCSNSNLPEYKHYGGRGISVCERWHKFENFFEDMGVPEKGMTIDRINVDGNYEPSNCKWASRKEQSRNTRVTNMLTYRGKTKPLAEWAEEYGQTFSDLYRHAITYKWDIERCLNWEKAK